MPVTSPVLMPSTSPVLMPVTSPVLMPSTSPVLMPVTSPVLMPSTSPVLMPVTSPVLMPSTSPVLMPVTSPVFIPRVSPVFIPASVEFVLLISADRIPPGKCLVEGADIELDTSLSIVGTTAPYLSNKARLTVSSGCEYAVLKETNAVSVAPKVQSTPAPLAVSIFSLLRCWLQPTHCPPIP